MKDNWRYKLVGGDDYIIDSAVLEDPTDKIIDILDGIYEDEGLNIWELIEGLPEKHKDLIWLYFYEGKTLESIARQKGCSKQNIHEQLNKALKSLRSLYDNVDYNNLD